MNLELNDLALQIVEDLLDHPEDFRVILHENEGQGLLVDCGIEAEGGLEAGWLLASVSMSGLAEITLSSGQIGSIAWPYVTVHTDSPVPACLFSQYAGWQINVGKYFAMGSGPMRAAAGREPLFDKLWYKESAEEVVGVLETSRLPTPEVFSEIAAKTGVEQRDVTLLVAPTSSPAGNYQVVARSIETALHKLYELGFDVNRVRSAVGTAPLSPVASNDLQGIGRTNDAILYGAQVTLFMNGDDDSLREIAPRIPSLSSPAYGKPFLDVFEAAGRDFYKIDPMLFSPAQVVLQNVDTGSVFVAGQTAPEILKQSFGLI